MTYKDKKYEHKKQQEILTSTETLMRVVHTQTEQANDHFPSNQDDDDPFQLGRLLVVNDF